MMRNSPTPTGSRVAYQTTLQTNHFLQHLGHGTNSSRDDHVKHGEHFSSNQLLSYNHPSPLSTTSDVVTNGALDFSSSAKCGSHPPYHIQRSNQQPFERFAQSPLSQTHVRLGSGQTSPLWYNTSSAAPTSPYPTVKNGHLNSSSNTHMYSSGNTLHTNVQNHQTYPTNDNYFDEETGSVCGDGEEAAYMNGSFDSNGYLISSRSSSIPYSQNVQESKPYHEGTYSNASGGAGQVQFNSTLDGDVRECYNTSASIEGSGCNADIIKRESSDCSDASNDQYRSNTSSVSAAQPTYVGQPFYKKDVHGRCQSSSSSSSTPPYHSQSSPSSNCVDANKQSDYINDRASKKHHTLSSSEANLERLKPSKGARGAQNLPPCRVCGNKASGLHFGVNTCEACNEFFRRSLKRGASYYCTKNRECQVYGKKRNACSYCRYHRCVEMGMSRDAIKTGRYSHKTRTEYAMEVEEFKQKEMHRAEQEKYEVLLADLVKYHDKYVKNTTRVPRAELLEHQSAYLNLYNTQKEIELRHPPLSSNMINKKLLNGWSPDGEDLSLTMHDVEMTEKWLRNYINYAKNVPGFKELALPDQASLVRGTWFEFWFLGAFRGYNSDLHVVYYPNGRTFHEEEIIKVFGKEYTDFSFSLADRMVTLDVTPEEMVLIKTVCLTFPDRTPLQNKDAVEQMHWVMVSCLLHTLEKNRPGDSAIFPLIVSKLVELRTLTDIAMRAHKSAIYQDVLKESPLLSEMVDTKTIYVNADPNGKCVSRTSVNIIPG